MIHDWKTEIGIAWMVKQAMMEYDKKKIFPYHLPELAASEHEISEAERQHGHPIDGRYKEFLRCANGWHSQSARMVFWFAGEENERFLSFDDYFLAMVQYARQDVEWLKKRQIRVETSNETATNSMAYATFFENIFGMIWRVIMFWLLGVRLYVPPAAFIGSGAVNAVNMATSP
jgi:hypothetical protein